MIRPLHISLLLTAVACSLCASQARQPSGRSSRIYPYVQRLDTVSGTWRTLNARARLTCGARLTTIVIWNTWADEGINPLVRITAVDRPEKNAENGKWQYKGTIFKTNDTGKDCLIESCTIIATTQNPDFTATGPDFSYRYRISRKPPKKP
ncbi:MAG: hypothetical protein LIO68_08520 [Rikenellaceae bacterium]|nr:hypothetical protein [Rikenellaceae bacterium]